MRSFFPFRFGIVTVGSLASLALAGCGGSTLVSPVGSADAASSADGPVVTRVDGGVVVIDATAPFDASFPIPDATPVDVGVPGFDAITPPPPPPPPPIDAGPPFDGGPIPADASILPDGSSCPATAPATASACTTVGEICNYGGTDCNCSNTRAWECHTCPATQPAEGSACMSGGAGAALNTCSYAGTDCTCAANAWSCGTCPFVEPTTGTACTTNGLSCGYTDGTCRCRVGGPGGGGGGGNPAWACAAACPVAQPAPGDTCTGAANQRCTYGTVTCDCQMGTYFCN
jgi:hypothetical protein